MRKSTRPNTLSVMTGLAVAIVGALLSSSPQTATGATASSNATLTNGNIGIHLAGLDQHDIDAITQTDLNYLKSKGVTLVRLQLSWEKLQPDLQSGLDQTALSNLKAVLTALAQNNIKAVLDLHQYGRYNTNWQQTVATWAKSPSPTVYEYRAYNPWTNTTRNDGIIGSADVPIERFQFFWKELAQSLVGQAGVWGYDLNNEPVRMGSKGVWQKAAQAAIDGIRQVDRTTSIVIEPYYGGDFSGDWPKLAFPEVTDPVNRIVYSPHVYFDQFSSGYYNRSYDDNGAYPTLGVDRVAPAIQWAKQHNAGLFFGEFGTPITEDSKWQELVQNTLAYFKQHGVNATWCQYAIRLPINPQRVPPGAWGWWAIQNNVMKSLVFNIMIQPNDQGVERPQMTWLAPYLGNKNPNDRLVLSTIETTDGQINIPAPSTNAAARYVVVAGNGNTIAKIPFTQTEATTTSLPDRLRITNSATGQKIDLYNTPNIQFLNGSTKTTNMVKGSCGWPIPKPITQSSPLCKTGTAENLRQVTGGDGKLYWNWICRGSNGATQATCGQSV